MFSIKLIRNETFNIFIYIRLFEIQLSVRNSYKSRENKLLKEKKSKNRSKNIIDVKYLRKINVDELFLILNSVNFHVIPMKLVNISNNNTSLYIHKNEGRHNTSETIDK